MEITSRLIKDTKTFEDFRTLLKSAGLPHQDLNFNDHVLMGFYDGDSMIGTGALEIYGNYALLRSLSVNDAARGRSIGSRITDELIEEAKKKKIKNIYLLTESARLFFKRKGFKDMPRENAPEEVKASTEFSQVCPDTAVCMVYEVG
jgi:amino-acid N-acetyltransferase